MSLARKHFQRVTAAQQAAATPTGHIAAGGIADDMATTMRLHMAALKNIQSVKGKIAEKRRFLPEYEAYIAGVLAAGVGAQDDVLARVMLWRIDVGAWADAMDIAAYAIRHHLSMPHDFSSSLPTMVLEAMSEQALTSGETAILEHLEMAMALTIDCDMPDQARAKGYKAIARLLAAEANMSDAIVNFEHALQLDPGCGVKTDLARCRKALEKATDQP